MKVILLYSTHDSKNIMMHLFGKKLNYKTYSNKLDIYGKDASALRYSYPSDSVPVPVLPLVGQFGRRIFTAIVLQHDAIHETGPIYISCTNATPPDRTEPRP